MSDFIQITTTSDKKEILKTIAGELIDRNLAACVQISGPIESHFRWKNKMDTCTEWSCSIKTMMQRQEDVISTIWEYHNYEEPEITVVTIVGGSQGYLAWIKKQTITRS